MPKIEESKDNDNGSLKIENQTVAKSSITNFLWDCARSIKKNLQNNDEKQHIDSVIVYYSGHGYVNDAVVDGNGEVFSFREIQHELMRKTIGGDKKKMKNIPFFYFKDTCRKMSVPQNEIKNMRSRGAVIEIGVIEEKKIDTKNTFTLNATINGKSIRESTETGSALAKAICQNFGGLIASDAGEWQNDDLFRSLARDVKENAGDGQEPDKQDCLNEKFVWNFTR